MTVNESTLLVRFPEAGPAYQALSELQQLDAALTGLDVRSAALLERRPDGTLHMPEGGDAAIGAGTASGGLVGMLIGVLGGPLGVLLGFGTGALVGGVVDIDRATIVDGTLALLSREVPPGSTVLILEAAEATPAPLDQLAACFDATVERTADLGGHRRGGSRRSGGRGGPERSQPGFCANASVPTSAPSATSASTLSRRSCTSADLLRAVPHMRRLRVRTIPDLAQPRTAGPTNTRRAGSRPLLGIQPDNRAFAAMTPETRPLLLARRVPTAVATTRVPARTANESSTVHPGGSSCSLSSHCC
jgi:uncharacterized membrane protein